MGTFYAAVEVFDPEGPNTMPDAAEYGGEARFFVLTADDLSESLATLANSISVNGLRLDRVLHAGAVEAFDDEILPFEVDIDGMAETAQGSGEICASEAHPFEPDESDGVASGVYAVCVDAFDMEWADEDEGEYGGHYQLAVIKAENAAAALQQLVEDFASEGIVIISLEGLVDAKAFPFDAYEFQFEEDDAVSEVLEQGGMIVSNAYAYPPEAPRKLDS